MNPILVGLAGAAVVYLLWTQFQSSGSSNGSSGSSGSTNAPGGLTLTTLLPSDIAAVAQAAGFLGDDLTTAVAVALAESSGNPNAYNPESAAGTPQGQGSYGLWQVYLKAHPEYAAANLFDPQTNANAAFQIYLAAGMSFAPWSTFKSGAYQKNIPIAQAVTA